MLKEGMTREEKEWEKMRWEKGRDEKKEEMRWNGLREDTAIGMKAEDSMKFICIFGIILIVAHLPSLS